MTRASDGEVSKQAAHGVWYSAGIWEWIIRANCPGWNVRGNVWGGVPGEIFPGDFTEECPEGCPRGIVRSGYVRISMQDYNSNSDCDLNHRG